MIVVRRSSNRLNTKREKDLIALTDHWGKGRCKRTNMSWCSEAHYTDIYDPAENPEHGRTRYVEKWGTLDDGTPICYKRYIPYEGYGSRSQEKFDYRVSLNKDHPLWSGGCVKEGGTMVGRKQDYTGSTMFDEEAEVKVIGENEVVKELIDISDRKERTSWNFSLMLSEFVEKCGPVERKIFFEEDSRGDRWSKNMELMKDFKRMFDWINQMKEFDKGKKISLSDQTVKDYPRTYYDQIEGLYTLYMNKKLGTEWWKTEEKEEKTSFKFNPNAVVFVPSMIFPRVPEERSPPKPLGAAPGKSRPHSMSGPDYLMPWRICEESDKKILELDRKLQMLINLHGPVVEAQRI